MVNDILSLPDMLRHARGLAFEHQGGAQACTNLQKLDCPDTNHWQPHQHQQASQDQALMHNLMYTRVRLVVLTDHQSVWRARHPCKPAAILMHHKGHRHLD